MAESRTGRAVPEQAGDAESAERTEAEAVLEALAVPVLTPPKPKVVVKADLLPAISAVSLIALLGLPLGWVWSRLAPAQQSVLGPGGSTQPLLVENDHSFDAIAIFALLAFATGVLTSVVLWRVRGRRGPVLLIGAVIGSAVASWLGISMGASFASSLYPMPPHPAVGDLITMAPEITTQWVLLVQPFAVALGYGVAVSWNGLDDLGRRRP